MRLYLCYADVDSYLVRSLAESLRAAHHDVWLADQILPGQNPDSARREAIERAGAFIYALTPESAGSRLCLGELDYALRLNKQVIPLRLQGNAPTPMPIRGLVPADFTQGPTPQNMAQLLGALNLLGGGEPVPAQPVVAGAPAEPLAQPVSQADELYKEAWELYRQKDYQAAHDKLRDALILTPEHADATKLLRVVLNYLSKGPQNVTYHQGDNIQIGGSVSGTAVNIGSGSISADNIAGGDIHQGDEED